MEYSAFVYSFPVTPRGNCVVFCLDPFSHSRSLANSAWPNFLACS
jgi:hypothetical protein